MVASILHDYRASMKENFQVYCKPDNNLWIYMTETIFIFPYLLSNNGYLTYFVFFDTMMVLWALLIKGMYPNRMGKNFYLCPMSEQERMDYMVTSYRIRVVMCLLPFAAGEIIWNLCTGGIGLNVIIKLYSYTLFVLTINCQGAFRKWGWGVNENKQLRRRLCIEEIGVWTGMINVILCGAVIKDHGPVGILEGISLIAQLIIYLVIKFQYRDEIFKTGMRYEDNY